MPAFDQIRVPRTIQVPSTKRCCKFIMEGFIICRWPGVRRNPFPPPMLTVHDCASQTNHGISSPLLTFEVLRHGSGFTAMSSGVSVSVRIPSLLEIIPDIHTQTKIARRNALCTWDVKHIGHSDPADLFGGKTPDNAFWNVQIHATSANTDHL